MIPVRQSIGGLGNLMFKQAYLYAQMRKGLIPDVYVQDEAYFKDYADEVKNMYSAGIGFTDMVSLHIRRGDYLDKDGFYVDLSKTNYYQEAVKHFPNSKFLVFCADRQNEQRDVNDRQWCIDFMDSLGVDYEMWYGGNETEDLNKMASCEGHIMANSSFSWWAAYLGRGKVVCPKQWFSDGEERCKLLDSWVLI